MLSPGASDRKAVNNRTALSTCSFHISTNIELCSPCQPKLFLSALGRVPGCILFWEDWKRQKSNFALANSPKLGTLAQIQFVIKHVAMLILSIRAGNGRWKTQYPTRFEPSSSEAASPACSGSNAGEVCGLSIGANFNATSETFSLRPPLAL